jgi:hypothetical protein
MKHLAVLNNEGATIILFTEKPSIKNSDGYILLTFEDGRLCSDKVLHKLSLVRREA